MGVFADYGGGECEGDKAVRSLLRSAVVRPWQR